MVCVYNIQASSSKYGDERRGSHFLIHQSQVLFRSPPCTCVYLPTDCVVQSLLWFPLLFRSTHLREATRLPRYTRLCTSSYYLIFKWKKNRIEGEEREKSTSFVCACVCVVYAHLYYPSFIFYLKNNFFEGKMKEKASYSTRWKKKIKRGGSY